MASNLLSDVAVRNAKAGEKIAYLRDGNGLYLAIHPNGSKYFQLRTALHGKEKRVQLGIYPTMSLGDAREAANAARKLVADGVDPVHEKRRRAEELASDADSTFKAMAAEWLSIKDNISNSYRDKIVATFNGNVYPRLGNVPVKDISPPMLLSALRHMEARGALELMGKCRGHGGARFLIMPKQQVSLRVTIQPRAWLKCSESHKVKVILPLRAARMLANLSDA